MPALPPRRLASTVVCATLLLGITGPAAMAADRDAPRGRTHASAPLPGPDVLLPRVQKLAEADRAVGPVAELLKAALTADKHRLPADEAARLGKAAEDAVTRIAPPTPAPTVPMPSRNDMSGDDMRSEALAALRKAVDDLVTATTSGNTGQVMPAATTVLNRLIGVLVASVASGVTMPAMPSLPSLPPSMMPKPTANPTSKPTPTTTPTASASSSTKPSPTMTSTASGSASTKPSPTMTSTASGSASTKPSPTMTPTSSASSASPSAKTTPSGTPTDPPQHTVSAMPAHPRH